MAKLELKLEPNKILDKITRYVIYVLAFLIPLFFLPFGNNVLDFQKQSLLVILTSIAVISFVLKGFLKGKLTIKKSFLNFIILALILVFAVSTAFSWAPAQSFFGFTTVNSGFLTLLSLVLFFFVLINFFESSDISKLIFISLGSAFLVALFSVFQIFGKFVLPWDFSKARSFNPIGSINSLGIYLSALLPLALILFFKVKKNWLKTGLGLFFVINLLILFLINFWVVWICLGVGMIALIVFFAGKEKGAKIVIPVILLIICFTFALMRPNLPGAPRTGIEVSPSYQASFEMTKKILGREQGSLRSLIGTGPGTFGFLHSLYKSKVLNNTVFWGVRFQNAPSQVLEIGATLGILGALSFLALIIGFAFFALKKITEKQKGIGLGLFAGWLSLTTGKFLYSAPLALEFLFWLFMALFLTLFLKDKISLIKKKKSQVWQIATSLVLIIILIGTALLIYFDLLRYKAEVYHAKAVRALNRGKLQQAEQLERKAINLIGFDDQYYRVLSRIYLLRSNVILRSDLSQEEKSQAFQPLMGAAVNSANRASSLSPKNVVNWSNRGLVYRNFVNLVRGADDWAIKSYEKALELEPTNPYFHTEIARIYITKARVKEEENLTKAKEELRKAINLKRDYWPAHFQEAVAYDLEGNLDEAITKMESIAYFNPKDPEVLFRLGGLYWRKEDLEKAEEVFKRAVDLSPKFANARYFLGLVYDKKEEKEKAIEQFEKIASFSKENKKAVESILKNLRQGKPALGEKAEVPPEPEEIPELEEEQTPNE